MSAQTTYGYAIPVGAPGGIVDLVPHEINSYANEENNGVLKPGLGVVQGTAAGQIKIASSGKTVADFLGIVTANRTTEYDLDGNIRMVKGKAVGVMRWGRIYGRAAHGKTVTIGEQVNLILTGDYAGCFCGASAPDGASVTPINGRFVGAVDTTTDAVAIDLYNQMGATAGAGVSLGDLDNVAITSPTDGQVLKYDNASSKWKNAADATE